jgi:hypothetical protein
MSQMSKRPTLDPAVDDDRMDAFPLPKPTLSVLDLLLEAGLGRSVKLGAGNSRENVFEPF